MQSSRKHTLWNTGIVAVAIKNHAIDIGICHTLDYRIGELDLIASTALLLTQMLKNKESLKFIAHGLIFEIMVHSWGMF